jgi:LysW-gamma-L-lysine carboxypeptidase
MSDSPAPTLLGLVSQYSPSGHEATASAWLVARMQSLAYDQSFVDKAGNAVGVVGSGPKQVVLLGHIDTVPGEISVRLRGDILYGRGTVDAKAPLACFTDAVAKLGPVDGWQFVVIGAVEEERDSEGARFAVEGFSPDFAIIGEPNRWDRVALGYKGSAWARVTVKRQQAHSASGEQTACEAAVELWTSIQAFAESFNTGKPRAFDKILPTLRGIESGADDFEQWARLSVGVRLPVDISPDDWYAQLGAATATMTKPMRTALERTGYAVPAWACEKNTPLVRAFLSGIRAHGGTPNFVYKTGTSDLNIVAPIWKCPAVVYGPGDSSLDHTPDEHISVEEYLKAVEVLRDALRQLVN